MLVECFSELTDAQRAEWQAFLAKARHGHAEQDARFAPVLRAEGNEVVFAMGRNGKDLCAVGLFQLHRHPFWPGKFRLAMSFSGPVCDDPSQFAEFVEALLRQRAFRQVGALQTIPYWLDDEAHMLRTALAAKGWASVEPDNNRQTGLVDISGSEAEIAARFSQTGRRKLRKAERLGLAISVVTDADEAMGLLPLMNQHREERGLRGISPQRFGAAFEHVYRTGDLGVILKVSHQDRFVAGLILHRERDTGHFMHSFHDDAILVELDNLRIAPFLLMQGMKWANQLGCRLFDLEGYKDPTDTADPLHHIYKYKSEFNPRTVHRITPHQKIGNPIVYLTGNARNLLVRRVKPLLRRLKGQA